MPQVLTRDQILRLSFRLGLPQARVADVWVVGCERMITYPAPEKPVPVWSIDYSSRVDTTPIHFRTVFVDVDKATTEAIKAAIRDDLVEHLGL